ncbi:PHP domain-containing protein [Solidesulfovibrio sp.]|uniref:PHP domain-containing protein n=1 Tax=Solidesulfovibrio sp. TaxID=2910990 RepID=UPI000EC82B89|nr:PHP domain-containing protein [Solidesulfovibrio sp.]MEA5087513.1 PHP domain-containing protein [Solidesulfovibrio sp.]HCR11753.1 PHP domain-containing protein [Desulfovibrio sp.]HML60486.1 PHP domain-containing protein [Solidesulfovibrio sp.]
MSLIDLHTHSTASDGSLSPGELVDMAAKKGLAALALTDHDTLDGLPEARAAGKARNIDVIAGVELSVADGERSVHLLGLFLPERPGPLAEALAYLRERRHNRNRLILDKLRALGVPLEYKAVTALAKGAVGRPHIAQAMLAMGAVTSFKEAFARYLGAHGRAYVPKDKLTLERAVALIHDEGGLAALAHPYMLGLAGAALAEIVGRYRDAGLDAIEALYTEHSQAQTLEYLALSRRFGLAVTGGSDYHGAAKPDVELGRGRGNLRVDISVLDVLRARLARRAAGAACGEEKALDSEAPSE